MLARINRLARASGARAVAALLMLASACSGDSPTSATLGADGHSLRLSIAPSLQAGAGAVVEGIVSYTPARSTTSVTLAHDSSVISNAVAGADASLALSANVAPCLDAAKAAGGTCTVSLTLRLKRDGVLLDERVQPFDITSTTTTVTVPAITLYEVATVNITPSPLTNFEPGDAKTLTATALDRNGAAVAARTVTWALVSGGVTISSAGLVTAVTPGPAVIRATVGGRPVDFAFTVIQPTVATLAVVPVDTLISVGGTAALRVTATSGTGAVLTGHTITYSSANPAIATVSASGVVTGVAVGSTSITAQSADGRNAVAVSTTVPLRVQAPPPVVVDRPAVSLDSVLPGTTSTTSTVAITTTAGQRISGLSVSTTYTPNVTPWLTATLSGTTTPATLTLQASSIGLAAGDYAADVRVISTTDPFVPSTIHVTLRVLAARRVTLTPKTVSFGTLSSSQATVPGTTVAVGTTNAVPLSGLAARIEYISTVTGWLTATLGATTAAPTTTLLLTPRPSGLADGAYQARVIVSSTTLGAGPDTVLVDMTIASLGRFTGLVQNAAGSSAVSGAKVVFRRSSDNTPVDSTTTGTDGRFTSNSLAAGAYSVVFSATGFVSTTLSDQQLTGSAAVPINTLPTVLLASSSSGSGAISGVVRDATSNAAVSAATVELRAGANNTTGSIIATTTTTTSGAYSFAAQVAGSYTVRATKATYAASSVTVTVSGAAVVAPVLFLSPGGSTAVWRFVLSWGTTPSDLDAHLTGPVAAGSTGRFHVYYVNPGAATASPFATLDVDQINGNGPETVTIWQQQPGVYRYFVYNFSQESALSGSNARVDVYQGNTLLNQFYVPAQPGTYWTVFEINGTVLTPINTMGTIQPSIVAGSSLRAPTSPSTPATRAADEWYSLFPSLWTKPPKPNQP